MSVVLVAMLQHLSDSNCQSHENVQREKLACFKAVQILEWSLPYCCSQQ